MRKNYGIKKSISIKQFITEFGEDFSEHMKERLLELESRCFLTRKEVNYKLDLKHVEHPQYDCACDSENGPQKEYSYGQFIINNDELYFSESTIENTEVMPAPVVSKIYSSLESDVLTTDDGKKAKKIDDKNIDFIVDSILKACPQVSQSYLDIIRGMQSRSGSK